MVLPQAFQPSRHEPAMDLEAKVEPQWPKRRIPSPAKANGPAEFGDVEVGGLQEDVAGVQKAGHGKIPVQELRQHAPDFGVEDDDRVAAQRKSGSRIDDAAH